MSLPDENKLLLIDRVPEGIHRPHWSVMIPTYNPRADYLEQALQSVLVQYPGPEKMQVEVVDDSSPEVDVPALVRQIAGNRVSVHRSPSNKGLSGNFNLCIERSRGQWVHILHQDDSVLPGFYQKLADLSNRHPEISLLASRSFFIDREDIIFAVSVRVHALEKGGRAADDFFYSTPVQCSSVVVRRSFYEAHGGFRSDLSFTLDCEMWARVVGISGGLVTPEVLAYYRGSDGSETSRLARTAEELRDLERLNQLFARTYPEFNTKKALERVCNTALVRADQFLASGDFQAAKANLDYWSAIVPAKLRFRRLVGKIVRSLLK